MNLTQNARRRLFVGVVASLLIVLVLELALSVRREGQTWDEACHIFAGYNYWTHGDFGANPEHPPLVKLLATAPLLLLHLHVPPRQNVFSKEEDFVSATQFVYSNNAAQILFRTRMAAALLTVLLAIVLVKVACETFGRTTALIALVLFTFEPNILAHGALVTTDMGFSCFLLITLYAFHRYLQRPSFARLVLLGLAAGLALATKHSAVLIFPILIALVAAELWLRKRDSSRLRPLIRPGAMQLAGVLVVALAIALAVLWASYGFRLHPRPGVSAEARVIAYAQRLHHPLQVGLIAQTAHWHLLPEAYLYGLADVGFTADFSHTYLFGQVYPHGQWFYFPVAFLIKSSPALLVLLLLLPFALVFRGAKYRRPLALLIIPALIYFAVAMATGLNIGVRHILPVYPLLMILAGWAAAELILEKRRLAYAVAFVLGVGIVSSVRVFPVYLAYANELWGGPANTYKYLSDSNVDWGQQLPAIKHYLDQRHVQECWFAYFAEVVAEPKYYGISCKPLTTIASVWLRPSIDVPASIDGPVLISAGTLSGYEFGPGELNPYHHFQRLRPTAIIDYGVFVFDGHFEIPLASALNHVTQAQLKQQAGRLDEALAEAQTAVQLAPSSVQAQAELGFLLLQLQRPEEAHQALERALTAAESIHPELQKAWVAGLHSALGQ